MSLAETLERLESEIEHALQVEGMHVKDYAVLNLLLDEVSAIADGEFDPKTLDKVQWEYIEETAANPASWSAYMSKFEQINLLIEEYNNALAPSGKGTGEADAAIESILTPNV